MKKNSVIPTGGSLFRTADGRNFLLPFLLVASLFFFWGFAHSLLDVLNKHFQDAFEMTKARSALIQASVYGGYFLMALPAGAIIRRWGYRFGVVLGLILYGAGALLFVPGAQIMSFPFFLLCLTVIGCGLTCLETAANPYVTVLGPGEGAARRINLAQSLNGLGWMAGPFIGGMMILSEDSDVALPYAIVGVIVLALALVFSRLKLPEDADLEGDTSAHSDSPLREMGTASDSPSASSAAAEASAAVAASATAGASAAAAAAVRPLHRQPRFVLGVAALFFYVAAQTGINSFFINYVTESDASVSAQAAAFLLSFGGMGMFFIGRLGGSFLMKKVAPATLVFTFAVGAALCMGLVTANLGMASIIALCATYLFESIMFPTIFSMALEGIHGAQAKTGGSILIMSIVGGAIAPVLMGVMGENTMAVGFLLPLICFAIIAAYAAWCRR